MLDKVQRVVPQHGAAKKTAQQAREHRQLRRSQWSPAANHRSRITGNQRYGRGLASARKPTTRLCCGWFP